MDYIQAVTLGVVQGLTEFLPVSSTAHLALVPWLLGWPDPGMAFNVEIQLGTLVAVLAYYRKDLWQLFHSWMASMRAPDPSDPYQKLSWLIIAGTIPGVIAGVLLEEMVATIFRSPYVIAGTLIGVGVLMFLAERVSKGERSWKELKLVDALIVGLAQACALIPGTSRSGATMTAGLFIGLQRADAARFSFLMSVPILFGAGVFELKHLFKDPTLVANLPYLAVGLLSAAISGYLCIHYLLKFLQFNTMTVFVVYRILLGIGIMVLIANGFSPNFAGH